MANKTLMKFRVWHWVGRERAFEVREARDEESLRAKLPKRLSERLIEIEPIE